jgi:hypothetical protein
METTKIKTKIGQSEFEAEGPVETVTAAFTAFLSRISSPRNENVDNETGAPAQDQQTKHDASEDKHTSIDKVLHVSGRVVSLTALPPSIEESALLIMLGHKDLRNNHTVTGQEIGDGLAQSGRPVPRVDRVMEKTIAEGFVLKSGIKRSTRYRLTNQGLSKAQNIAKVLLESLP